jgi:hypothetical protein
MQKFVHCSRPAMKSDQVQPSSPAFHRFRAEPSTGLTAAWSHDSETSEVIGGNGGRARTGGAI